MNGDVTMTDSPIGQPCVNCEETIVSPDCDVVRIATVINDETGFAWVHWWCQTMGIVGHTFGVCHCSGYEYGAAARAELRRRTFAAGRTMR